MIFFGVIIGLITMGVMVYLAIDKKSNFLTRIVSLGALALMILTLIICIVVVLTDNRVPVDESNVYVGVPENVEVKEDNNILAILIPVIFLLILLSVVIFLAMREHKRSKMQK